jgi:hypothetical protein
MDNQNPYTNPYIKGERTTQWPKGKVQKDKQRYTQHTHKTKDRVTQKEESILNTSEKEDLTTGLFLLVKQIFVHENKLPCICPV